MATAEQAAKVGISIRRPLLARIFLEVVLNDMLNTPCPGVSRIVGQMICVARHWWF
jgi:hypothetical protein